jgi:Na+/H+-dicarboxylate symporter
MKRNKLTTWIAIAMAAGVAVGYLCNTLAPDAAAAKQIAGYISVLSDIFLRLIKMIIAPLVIATLVAGLAGIGDSKAVGRIGGKALGWFITAFPLLPADRPGGANVLRPGDSVGIPLPEAGTANNLKTSALNLKDFITHVFPSRAASAPTFITGSTSPPCRCRRYANGGKTFRCCSNTSCCKRLHATNGLRPTLIRLTWVRCWPTTGRAM